MGILNNSLPMYEGDSIIRPGLSNTDPISPREVIEPARVTESLTIADLVSIDKAAHRMRAEAVAALLSGGWKRLVAFVKGDGKTFEEQYLAQSTDLVDLEMRQRDLARGNRFRMPLGRPSYI